MSANECVDEPKNLIVELFEPNNVSYFDGSYLKYVINHDEFCNMQFLNNMGVQNISIEFSEK
jgi:hypothetical protein